MADEGEDGPPPLEDMSSALKQMALLKQNVDKHQNENPRPCEKSSTEKKFQQNTKNTAAQSDIPSSTRSKLKPAESRISSIPPPPCGFGGMKKGFLFGGGSSTDGKKSKNAQTTGAASTRQSGIADTMPHIKSNPSKGAEYMIMPEVQRMRDQLQQTDAWLTEDLLNKLGNNDRLMTMMADPRCEKALQEFQANPDKALATYQHDKYIQEFFREFCDVLGSHYENLHNASCVASYMTSQGQTSAVPPPPPVTEQHEDLIKEVKSTKKRSGKALNAPPQADTDEDAKVQKVLSDPQLVEILQSTNIKDLIRSLKEDPEKAQKLLQEGGKEFQEKVRTLVDAGLLAFQR